MENRKKSRYEYWNLTLEDIKNNTELSQKYPDIDEKEWHRINAEPESLIVDGEAFNEPYLLEDWDFKNKKPKYPIEKLRENYKNYIESLKCKQQ